MIFSISAFVSSGDFHIGRVVCSLVSDMDRWMIPRRAFNSLYDYVNKIFFFTLSSSPKVICEKIHKKISGFSQNETNYEYPSSNRYSNQFNSKFYLESIHITYIQQKL